MVPTVRAWLLRPGPRGADGALAVLVAAISGAEIVRTGPGEASLGIVLALSLVAAVALAWRRVAALPVALSVYTAILTTLGVGFVMDNLGQFLAHLVASYSLGAHSRGRAASPWVGVAVVAAVGAGAWAVLGNGDAVGLAVLLALLWILGRTVNRGDRTVADLRDQTRRLQEEREARTAAALAEERARIARELHDVVAHAVSLMVLQTGAGRKAIDVEPERATQMLLAAEETGRVAVAEMKRLVGIMREDEPGLGPQPGLNQVADLVDQARSTGKPIDLVISGEPRPVSPGLDLAAYRIVQEALTNSIRHAGATTAASVRIHHRTDSVDLEIEDSTPKRPLAWPPAETGHGLAGMRERTALYDGRLEAGPGPGGGLLIRARLPVTR